MATTTDRAGRLRSDHIVDNRVYWDPRVFDAERGAILERVWLFACHASEIPSPGDFLTLEIAGTPLVIARGNDDEIRAFCNTCRHRGSAVVDELRGHCGAFRCPYHSWVYSLEGKLVNVPGEEAYEGSRFDKRDFPLFSVACESVFGLVFVNLRDDPEPLTTWLGERVIEALRKPLGDAVYEVFYSHSDELPVNWKVFAENSRDGYHVAFVHSFLRKASPPGTYHLLDNGHAIQHLGMDSDVVEPDVWADMRKYTLPGLEEGEGYIVNLFPDLGIQVRSNVVSLDFQRIYGPTHISMENRLLGVAGDTPEMTAARAVNGRFWVHDPVQLQDYPVFRLQQRGTASRKVRYSVVARGTDATTGTRGDDNRLRQFWSTWRELLGVPDNSLDPLEAAP